MRRIDRSSRRVGLVARAVTVVSVVTAALLGTVAPVGAAPRVMSVTVGAQSNTLTAGVASSATFEVTVAKGTTFSLTADLTVVTGLPSGVSGSFGATTPLTWGSFLPAGTTRTATLTVSTTALAAAGAIPFTVRAERRNNTGDFAVGSGTLTISPAGSQTISFGPLPDRALGDPDFTVSAVASSGLPVSFAAAGACSLLPDGVTVHLGTSPGQCTITASQAGGSGFSAAADVVQSFTVYDASAGVDLYAVAGSTTLGSQTVPVWGYGRTNDPATQPGGPTITVDQGTVVTIRLHNTLGEKTGLLVQGQGMVPDLTGVAPGGTKAYTFTASRPGTYVYEATLLPNAQHQVAMGLYGALVVRPTDQASVVQPNWAYDASTDFDDQAVLLLSEVDPALNTLANPATFDMRNFRPRYFLINGKVYPGTDPIGTAPGNEVLLRYVNAGTQYHSMGVMGTHQTMVALDGSLLQFSRRYVAETIGPGQTADAIVTIPNATPNGARLAVHDANLLLHNSNTAGLGGMLTFMNVIAAPAVGDAIGPITSGVAFDGSTLNAVVDDTTTGGAIPPATIQAAEYFVDSVPATTVRGTAMGGTFGGLSASVSQASVALTPGPHVLYVRGQDSAGNWGAISSVLWAGDDTTGPITRDASLAPAHPVNNGTTVALHATGDDSTTGGSNIQAAEYTIDGLNPQLITPNVAAPIASLDATISVTGLADGIHPIAIRSQDSANVWGAPITIDLVVDNTGPAITAGTLVVAAPNPNDGTQSFTSDTQMLRVTANFTDLGAPPSGLRAGEGFIDTVGANGTGFPFAAVDGVFDETSEAVSSDIPLATIQQLAAGDHTIYVHAKDAAGNWGAVATTVLVKVSFRDVYFSTAGDTLPLGVAGTADDADIYHRNGNFFSRSWDATNSGVPGGANVDGYERVDATHFYLSFSGNTTLPGIGAVQDEDVVYYNAGTWSVWFNGTDPDGNPATPGLTAGNQDLDEISIVGGILYFSTVGNTNPPGLPATTPPTPADDADIYSWNGTSFARVWDATANGLGTGANVDGLQFVDATHFYLSFSNATTAVPGIGNVQDEDVVYYNAGTWSVYFDGTAYGLNASGDLDLDAIDVP